MFFGYGAKLLKKCSDCRTKVIETEKPLNTKQDKASEKPSEYQRVEGFDNHSKSKRDIYLEQPSHCDRSSLTRKEPTNNKRASPRKKPIEIKRDKGGKQPSISYRDKRPLYFGPEPASPTEKPSELQQPYRLLDCSYFREQDEYLGEAKKVAYDFMYGRL